MLGELHQIIGLKMNYIEVRVYAIVGDSKTLRITTKGLLIPRYFVSQIPTGDGRTRTVTESTVARWVDFKGNLSVRPDLGFWDRTAQGNKWRIEFVELDPGSQKYEETISHSSEFTIGIKLTDAFTKTFRGGFDASYKGVQSGSTKITYNASFEYLS